MAYQVLSAGYQQNAKNLIILFWITLTMFPNGTCPGFTSIFIDCDKLSVPDAFGARNKIMRGLEAVLNTPYSGNAEVSEAEAKVEHEFLCPITHEVMADPVVAAGK